MQAKKQSILQAIEDEEKEYEEMVSTNTELKAQRDKLLAGLTEMKDKIEILHAEISREGASNYITLYCESVCLYVYYFLHVHYITYYMTYYITYYITICLLFNFLYILYTISIVP